jgi:hypothetical protein
MAQLTKFDISPKHAFKIERLTSGRDKIIKYHKYFHRDSLKQVRELKKYWKFQSDSMSAVLAHQEGELKNQTHRFNSALDEFSNDVLKERNKSILAGDLVERISPAVLKFCETITDDYLPPDSVSNNINTWMAEASKFGKGKLSNSVNAIGSKALNVKGNLPQQLGNPFQKGSALNEKLSVDNEATKYLNEFHGYGNKLSSIQNAGLSMNSLANINNRFVTEAANLSKANPGNMQALGSATRSAQQFKNPVGNYQQQVQQFTDSAYLKAQAKKRAEEMAMQYLNSNPEILKAVQAKMNLLMKKYSVIPNSNDLSTATKRTSLKGKSFGERLVIAGNFQLLTLKPVSLDFSPQVGYRFNTRFVVGLGGTYRKTFSDSLLTLSPNVFGYKAFTSYDAWSSYFAYAEFDYNTTGIKKDDDGSKRIWKDAFLAGVGRTIQVHPKVNMTISFLYDFLYKPHDPLYARPWMVRIGVQSSALAMKKKR